MSFLSFLGFGKMVKDGADVLKFPEVKAVPKMPEVKPPEKPATVFYRLGMTDNNRVSLSMGVSEILMTKEGVENLIAQLASFRDTLAAEVDNTTDDDPNGGEPIPVPEEQQKVA
jgi:hypothetical protein